MSRSLNKATLIGNVGQEPEIRSTSGGTMVAKLSLATNRQWKDRAGNVQEKTDWHRLTVFGKLADVVEAYVHKGDKVYVEGRIEYSQTNDADGNVRYWTDIVVDQLLMLGGNREPAIEEWKPPQASAPTPATVPQGEPQDDLPF